MKAKITLHIYAKTDKANTAGQLPIYFRLTVNGKRFEFSTKKFIDKSKWSSELSKMKGNSEEARTINSYLDLMKSKVFDIQMDLIHKNEDLSAENFKSRLLGNHQRERTIIPIYQDRNDKIKEVERTFLTEEELLKIYNKRFATERLTLVKDIFIF